MSSSITEAINFSSHFLQYSNAKLQEELQKLAITLPPSNFVLEEPPNFLHLSTLEEWLTSNPSLSKKIIIYKFSRPYSILFSLVFETPGQTPICEKKLKHILQ
ncbi:hypothetical protein HMI54_012764, partial [Coelomomyces lativittatus]